VNGCRDTDRQILQRSNLTIGEGFRIPLAGPEHAQASGQRHHQQAIDAELQQPIDDGMRGFVVRRQRCGDPERADRWVEKAREPIERKQVPQNASAVARDELGALSGHPARRRKLRRRRWRPHRC
jgi:hypothetical protein